MGKKKRKEEMGSGVDNGSSSFCVLTHIQRTAGTKTAYFSFYISNLN